MRQLSAMPCSGLSFATPRPENIGWPGSIDRGSFQGGAGAAGSDRDSPDIDRSEQFPLSRGRKVNRAIGPQVVLKFVLESKSKSCGYWSALEQPYFSWGKPWRAFACLRREKKNRLPAKRIGYTK